MHLVKALVLCAFFLAFLAEAKKKSTKKPTSAKPSVQTTASPTESTAVPTAAITSAPSPSVTTLVPTATMTTPPTTAPVVSSPSVQSSPSSSPTFSNYTGLCHERQAAAYCEPMVPPYVIPADFPTACSNAMLFVGNILNCEYSTTQFGNCTYEVCLADCSQPGNLDALNSNLTAEVQKVYPGPSGVCEYASCEVACTAIPVTSAGSLLASSLLAVVAAVALRMA